LPEARYEKPRINLSFSSKKVNDFLLQKYGISLFTFAQVFALSPFDSAFKKFDIPFKLQQIRAIRNLLFKMLDDIFKRARLVRSLLDKMTDSHSSDISENELVAEMGLEEFLVRYFYPQLMNITLIEFARGSKQGIRLNKKSIIAVGWGNLLSNRGHRIDWQILGDLYFWFWEKVAPYPFYKEWEPVWGLDEYLKVQFYRHRLAGGIEKYIRNNPSISEMTRPEFFVSLYLMRLGGIKGPFPEKKFPIPIKELPRFMLNSATDYGLSNGEGLSLFSKNGSFADPQFEHLYYWLRTKVNNDLLPKPGILHLLPKKIATCLYEGSEIEDYFLHAIEIYLNSKADLKNIPPMIVFPDLSYFKVLP